VLGNPAARTGLGRRKPAVTDDQLGVQPGRLVAELATELRPGYVADRAGEVLVADEVGNGEVFDDQPAVGLGKVAGDLVQEASS
jgi:hypothetical protein